MKMGFAVSKSDSAVMVVLIVATPSITCNTAGDEKSAWIPAPHFWKIAAPRASFQLVPRPLPRCSRSNRILSTRMSLCEPGFCLLRTRTVSCPPPCHVEPPSCVCLCHVQSLPHRGCLPNFRTHPPFLASPLAPACLAQPESLCRRRLYCRTVMKVMPLGVIPPRASSLSHVCFFLDAP